MVHVRFKVLSILFLLLLTEGCKKSNSGSPESPAPAAPPRPDGSSFPRYADGAATPFFRGAEDRDVRVSEEQSEQRPTTHG